MAQTDPYQILNLDPNSSIEEVNRAYFYIAKMYHPNKGGNKDEFLRFQRAYKQIISSHQGQGHGGMVAPKDFNDLRGQSNQPLEGIDHRYSLDDFQRAERLGQDPQFNTDLFNQKFRDLRDHRDLRGQDGANANANANAYTYNIDEMDAADRDADAYKREYAQVTAEAENVTPFGNGQFNNATFNHVFVHMKERNKGHGHGLGQAGPEVPEPLVSGQIDDCITLDERGDGQMPDTGTYTGYNEAYRAHRNPSDYDKRFLAKFQGKPDITKVTSLSSGEVKRRVGDWHNTKLDYNKEKLITDRTVQLQDVRGVTSKKAASQMAKQRAMLSEHARLQAEMQARVQMAGSSRQDREMSKSNDMFQRMAQLRAPVHVPTQNMLGPDRPMSSTAAAGVNNRETAGMIHQPAAVLLQTPNQAHGKPPPLHKKRHKHKKKHGQGHTHGSASSETLEDELRKVKRHLKEQQKLIRELSRTK